MRPRCRADQRRRPAGGSTSLARHLFHQWRCRGNNVIPVLFSAAGRTSNVPTGSAIAGVATAGYVGFLAGPPLIGVVAQATILPVGLGLVVLCCAPLALLAGSAGTPLARLP